MAWQSQFRVCIAVLTNISLLLLLLLSLFVPRVVKVCGLARGVSSEAMGRINRLKAELRTSQEEVCRSKRRYRNMAEEQAALKAENERLRRRLALLEQGRLADDCSACAREYMYASVSLY
jgi:hypothetical protein